MQIMRCPVLAECVEKDGHRRGCYEVATGPGGPHSAKWVPEPWVGHLTEAPLLFVSSNPGGGRDPSDDPEDPSSASSDEILLACQDKAFDEDQRPGITDGAYLVNRHGVPGKWVPYWGWARRRAEELLLRSVFAGHDYALSEVVHCGGPGQAGVAAALSTCVERYLEKVLAASPSRVVIVVGKFGREGFNHGFHLALHYGLVGPIELSGRERLLITVPHPNSRGGPKSLSAHLSREQLAQARKALVD